MAKKDAVIVIADTHINSTFSHWPKGVQKDDGGFHQRNKVQDFLAWAWEDMIEDVLKRTKRMNRTLILNGDLGEMDSKSRSWQNVQQNTAVTVSAMKKVFHPVMDKVNDTFVIRGTEAHTGKSAHLETLFAANDHDSVVYDPMDGSPTWWHLRATFGGVKFDVAHHGAMGQLPWTQANAANKLAVTTIMQYYEWKETPPDVTIRSHNHRYADSGGNFDTFAVMTPGFQWKNSYIHRIGQSNSKPQIGMLLFVCQDGEYTMEKLHREPRRPRPWTKENQEENPRLL